jgi:hypothetical protein
MPNGSWSRSETTCLLFLLSRAAWYINSAMAQKILGVDDDMTGDFIEKPFSIEALRKKVKEILYGPS